jgi:hypothetical protein
VWALCATPTQGQSVARVRTSENIRRVPNGEVLARVEPGATFTVVGRQDRWLQVDMEGWVWSRSLQVTDEDGFDLTVSEAQGENLRAAPSGGILARLGRGMLLEELDRSPGWIQVRRRAWVWAESVVETSVTAPTGAVAAPAPTSGPAAQRPGGFAPAGAAGSAVLSAPGGDTLAHMAPGTEMEVVGREGSWARVRLEGWTWMPPTEAAPAEAAPEKPLTPDDLSAAPGAYRGRVVEWRLQFISVEHAEKVRTDFFEGEPFLLTRFGDGDGPFVYVALPPDRIPESEGLVPLERLRVTGRIRTGASSLTGTPIIDLVALERVRDDS